MSDVAPGQRFRALFGIERQRLGPGLVVSPFLSAKQTARYLRSPHFFRGVAFSGVQGIFNGMPVSFVCAGMGHTLVTDCVLAQDARHVTTVIFVGAVGAWRERAIGDCVLIGSACFDTQYYRQFPGVGISADVLPEYVPDVSLALHAENKARERKLSLFRLAIASVNSLWQQEEDMVPRLQSHGARGVDLECALFYAAAAQRGIPAAALAVVTDIPDEHPYWGAFSMKERRSISQAFHRLLPFSLAVATSA